MKTYITVRRFVLNVCALAALLFGATFFIAFLFDNDVAMWERITTGVIVMALAALETKSDVKGGHV